LFAFPLKSDDKYSGGEAEWDWQGLDKPQKTYSYSDVIPRVPEIQTTTTAPDRRLYFPSVVADE
jgi:hypothetical protein